LNILLPRHEKSAPPPAWPFVGLGLIALGGIFGAASLLPQRFHPPCGFHLVTGHPCPTCGSTRAAMAMLHGRVAEAFEMNPLFTLVLGGLVLWVAAGAVARLAGRDLRLDIGPREGRWLWVLLAASFFANWAYLWVAGV
jgi:hypothetical protein